MLLEQTHEKMIVMKLYGMAGALKERLESEPVPLASLVALR